jgi:AAA domain
MNATSDVDGVIPFPGGRPIVRWRLFRPDGSRTEFVGVEPADYNRRQDRLAAVRVADAEAEAAATARLEAQGARLQAVDPRWKLCDLECVLDDSTEDPPLLIEALQIGLGSRPVGLWGAPGSGKNDTAQSIAVCVAAGREDVPLFGRIACARGRVLHLTYDMPQKPTVQRYAQLANGMQLKREEVEGQIVISAFPSINLCTGDAEQHFARLLSGFDLVIVDNARNAIPGADENDSRFGDYLNALGAAADYAKCTAIYLHHTKKGATPGLTAARGTGAILAASGTIWFLDGEGDEPRTFTNLRHHDLADGLCPTLTLHRTEGREPGAFRVNPKRLQWIYYEARDAARPKPKPDATHAKAEAAVLTAVRATPGLGIAALRKACPGMGGNGTIDQAVATLISSGQVEDRGAGRETGRGHAYYPVQGVAHAQ